MVTPFLSGGGPQVVWSPDGKKVAYLAIHNKKFADLNSLRGVKAKCNTELYDKIGLGVYVYDFNENKAEFIGYGGTPIWKLDSKALMVSAFGKSRKGKIRILSIDEEKVTDLVLKAGCQGRGTMKWRRMEA